ncbi:anthocyanidin 3-O-glucosyltransferase 2-like [Salvia miltiorrhiza]|uniref:anthocyanidin 3-O-glucosyltransferase 2-like n=1 Tax=Salvia miltiorrhiza TaxID=226208 RepID=UPI0025AC29A2|nr:anthocyanidin 3-O-glucosyltransferase 2-like [Salvia miltiorrhiza]
MPEEITRLIFVPLPVLSHLLPTIKLAKLLTDRDDRLSITLLIINLQFDNKISSYIKNSPNSRINFVELERVECDKSPKTTIFEVIASQKPAVRAAAAAAAAGGAPEPGKLAGVVYDNLCSSMMDVAAELGVPSYIFFTCGAAILGLLFRLAGLMGGRDRALTEYEGSDAEISVATFFNPVPAKVWPSTVLVDGQGGFLGIVERLRSADGIIVNTFLELEEHAITALAGDDGAPAIYPLGPLLQDEEEPANDGARSRRVEILEWLDEQPDSSVVFLCFGTNGWFNEAQVREIAAALEGSGSRFLWSLRKPPLKENGEGPREYENPDEVLPEGFLERTASTGMVIGWAPQMAVLSHRAVGGFVSHCGWNSILESISCGVPIATWPMFADQQSNAFQLVKELEIAVEIKMDYRKEASIIVTSDKIEKGIRDLMNPKNKIRSNVKKLMGKSRGALIEGGSSYNFVHFFIENVKGNLIP